MGGFGSGSFGSGPFGADPWSERVLWADAIDGQTKAEDADPNGGDGALRGFIDAVRPMFDELKGLVDDWRSLRDPREARASSDGSRVVEIEPTTVTVGAETVTLDVVGTPAQVIALLDGVGAGWIAEDRLRQRFTVNAVRKLDKQIDVAGTVAPDLGTSQELTLRAPSMLELLAGDYGVVLDRYEPTGFQRSSVLNVSSWLSMKGAVRAYEVLARISGYRAEPLQLWRVSTEVMAAVPGARLYEIPSGSGRYFTDLVPLQARFDEVSADAVLGLSADASVMDLYAWSVVDVGGVEMTVEEVLRQTVTILTATVVDAATGRYTLTATGPMWRQTWPGVWYIEESTGRQLVVETIPQDVGGGVWEFDVILGSSSDGPEIGDVVHGYWFRPVLRCGYCPASVVQVKLYAAEVLTEPEAMLDNAYERMVSKFAGVIPAHVREVGYTLVTQIAVPLSVSLGIAGTVSTEVVVPVSPRYDLTPADAVPTDDDGLSVGVTVTITP